MENDITKLGEGMKWDGVERSGSGAFRTIPISVRDYVKELQELLEKYPDAVFRDEGYYEERVDIYIQVPKTKSEYLYDRWEKSGFKINDLKSSINNLNEKFTSRVKIIESDKRIPEETLDKIDAEDPDGDYILMNPKVLVKQEFDKEGWEKEVNKICEDIEVLKGKRAQYWKEYQEARTKGE